MSYAVHNWRAGLIVIILGILRGRFVKHHGRPGTIAEDAGVLTLKGNRYRLRNTEIDTLPSHRSENRAQ
jgi:hypothetical protein